MTRRLGFTAGVLVGICAASWAPLAAQTCEICSVRDVTLEGQAGAKVQPDFGPQGLIRSCDILDASMRVRNL